MLHLPVDRAKSRGSVLRRFQVECVIEAAQSLLALPLLSRGGDDIRTCLRAALETAGNRRWVLQAMCVVARFCGRWRCLGYAGFSELLTSEYVQETEVEEAVGQWIQFINETVRTEYEKETDMDLSVVELVGSGYCCWFEMQ